MGKETKIGLSIIAVLLVVFAGVLVVRLWTSDPEASKEEVAAKDPKDKDKLPPEKAKPKVIPASDDAPPGEPRLPKLPSKLDKTDPWGAARRKADTQTPKLRGPGDNHFAADDSAGAGDDLDAGANPDEATDPGADGSSDLNIYGEPSDGRYPEYRTTDTEGGLDADPGDASSDPESAATDEPRAERGARRDPFSRAKGAPLVAVPADTHDDGSADLVEDSEAGADGAGADGAVIDEARAASAEADPALEPADEASTDAEAEGADANKAFAPADDTADLYEMPEDEGTASTAPPTELTDEPAVTDGETYAVAPRDSFWTISEKVYGMGDYFEALREHNRAEYPRGVLRVGDVVSVPPVDVLEQTYPELCPRRTRPAVANAGAEAAPAELSESDTGRVYVVQEGDTLFDIARHELGKSSRWSEIFELNRGQLGEDFNFLRPGTKLQLPEEGEAAALSSRPRTRR